MLSSSVTLPARRPVLVAALALVAGALAGTGALPGGSGPGGLPYALLVGGLLAAALLRACGRRLGLPVWPLWLALGAGLRAAVVAPNPARNPIPSAALARARDAPVLGRFHPLGAPERGWLEPLGDGAAILSRLELEFAGPPPRAGELVLLLPSSEIQPWPRGPVAGPRARDGRWLGRSFVRADEWVRAAPREPGNLSARIAAGARALRERALARLHAALDGRSAAMLGALLLGEREGLSPELRTAFRETASLHLLAISGLHVGLVALFLRRILDAIVSRWAGLRPALAPLFAVLLAVHALVVGAEPPVVRASIAIGWALFPPRRGGLSARADGLSLWALALACEAACAPGELTRPALLLSYGATLGLLLGYGPLRRSLCPAHTTARLPALGPWRRAARSLGAACSRGAGAALAASFAAVGATLPCVAGTFGEWSPWGIVLSPLAVPLLATALAGGWAFLLTDLSAPAEFAAASVTALARLVEAAAHLPATPALLPMRPTALWLVTVACAFVALAGRDLAPRLRRRVGRLAALLAAVLLLPWRAAPAGLELVALDVGHGSSFVLRAPGLPALVFDAGSRDRTRIFQQALGPLLASWEVPRPLVVLSHDHADHASELVRLAERLPPRAWVGADSGRRPPGRRLDLDGAGVLRLSGATSDLALRLHRGAEGDGNEGSRTLEVLWRGQRIVLSGDAEGSGLRGILARPELRDGRPCRLALAPHHGSETPLLGAWLDTLGPREVWVSSARPPPIARELTRRAIPWSWTGAGDGVLALELRP